MWIEVKPCPAPMGAEYTAAYYTSPGLYVRGANLYAVLDNSVTRVDIQPDWVQDQGPADAVKGDVMLGVMDRMVKLASVLTRARVADDEAINRAIDLSAKG